MNSVVFSGLLPIAVGIGVMLETSMLVEVVLLTEIVGLLRVAVVDFDPASVPSVMLGLRLVLELELRLGIFSDVVVVDPSSLLTATKRMADARSRHRQRHSNALAR